MTTLSTRDRRNKTPRPGFGLGLHAGTVLLRSWTQGAHAFDVIEDPLWFERDQADAWPFRLYWTTPAGATDSKGFDSKADSECYAEHLSTPIPTEPATHEARCEAFDAFLAAEAVEDARAARPGRFEPTAEDRQWLVEHPVAGGAPEPDWDAMYAESFMMDRVEDMVCEPELSDDHGGGWGGHPA